MANEDKAKIRRRIAKEFLETILDEEDRPFWVSDESSLSVEVIEGEEEVVRRCLEHFGVVLTEDDFRIPFGELLDKIESERSR